MGGFLLLARLTADATGSRLAGTWQGWPGSCCQGRGRMEVEIKGKDTFIISGFSPALDKPTWSYRPGSEFKKTKPLAPVKEINKLTGVWRVSLWNTGLLPNGRANSFREMKISFASQAGRAVGRWPGRSHTVTITPGQEGYLLEYRDPEEGFSLTARLEAGAAGFSLAGPYKSTLGQGVIRLVRAGLPADPPGPAATASGDLSGLWVDPRTGSDFFEIQGSAARGFRFTAYGGLRKNPRYLTRGLAKPDGEGRFTGAGRDPAGYCCGNQGRLIFRLLEKGKMEVRSFWWPQGRPDPGTEPGNPYVLVRSGATGQAGQAKPGRGGWPAVYPAKPGLLSAQSGTVRIKFTWRPGAATGPQTLFYQGGYLSEVEIFINAQGRIGARAHLIKGGRVSLLSSAGLQKETPHELWFSYQAGAALRLFIDGKPVAEHDLEVPLAQPASPYLLGGSRREGRTFSGAIESVELYTAALVPSPTAQPPGPDLVLKPEQPVKAAGPVKGRQVADLLLFRLWHPKQLRHAYAVRAARVKKLKQAGYVPEGPVALLAGAPGPGKAALTACRNQEQGYTLLAVGGKCPAGHQPRAALGYIWQKPGPGLVPLHGFSAVFPEPLRGAKSSDRLYTTFAALKPGFVRAGYARPVTLGYVKAAKESMGPAPVLYTWSGAWRGEGWGRFFVMRVGSLIRMFWYYSDFSGPHYLGLYRLGPKGLTAQGYAVGKPGPRATYYRHKVLLDFSGSKGPRLKILSWRLAAPLDDGRLVKFGRPEPTQTTLYKISDQIPEKPAGVLKGFTRDPAGLLETALDKAQREGRLITR